MTVRTAVLLAVALLAAAPAAAREFTADELLGLEAAVADFNAAFAASDWAKVMSVVPPKVLEKISADHGLSPAEVQAQMVKLMDEALAAVTVESYGIAVDEATYGEGLDGTPYALIPTTTVISMGEELGKIRSSNLTIAFMDDGEWYLVRGNDGSTVLLLRQVYPTFANISVPPGTTEPVE